MTTATPTPMAERTRIDLGPGYRRIYVANVAANLGDGVGQIGYPWLASAVTRNPLLIALVAVAQRLPWLLFTLPAGVITDRVDRRRAIVAMDLLRAVLTAGIAIAVLALGSDLPSPDELADVTGTRTGLYLVVVVASLLLGFAEVLRDNANQTILPAVVDEQHLERANGRMWAAETVANTFVGPPVGSVLLAAAFALPFVVNAGAFAVAAGLVALVSGSFVTRRGDAAADAADGDGPDTAAGRSWTTELREGVRWLWRHRLLRTLAIVLGLLNLVGALEIATLVLFAQEVLRTSPLTFAVLTMGGAVGAMVGGYVAAAMRRRLGSGPTLWLTLVTTVIVPLACGLTSSWLVVFVAFGVAGFTSVLWNVITVSLRQRVIPDHLLGRVNSVYRFFGWGMMPIGTAIGGVVVALAEPRWGREAALRAPWFAAVAISVAIVVYAVPRLTTAAIDGAEARPARSADE